MELQPAKPQLEYLCRANLELIAPVIVGKTPLGERRIYPFNGKCVGEKLSGEVLPGGADSMLIRPDGIVLVDARYAVRTPDNATVYIHNVGRRSGSREVLDRLVRGEQVEPNEYYYRMTPEFETEAEQYSWLNDIVGVASGARQGNTLHIDFYVVR